MRYISADAFINNLKGILEAYADNGLYPTGFGIEDTIDMIEDMPTADVQEVNHGRWVKAERRGCVTYHDSYAECSNCHGEPLQFCRDFKYCPWCGAKMDGGENEAV